MYISRTVRCIKTNKTEGKIDELKDKLKDSQRHTLYTSTDSQIDKCTDEQTGVSTVLGVTRYLCNELRNIITFVVTK